MIAPMLWPGTMVPLWRGDCFTFNAGNYGTSYAYRITSLSLGVVKSGSTADPFEGYKVRYQCELIVPGTSLGCGHRTLGTTKERVMRSHERNILSNKEMHVMPGSESLLQLPAISTDYLA
jgi:hypothetical protein